jgi:hypothetical protein
MPADLECLPSTAFPVNIVVKTIDCFIATPQGTVIFSRVGVKSKVLDIYNGQALVKSRESGINAEAS